jgi:hypothetical protein
MDTLTQAPDAQFKKQSRWFIRPYEEGDEAKIFELHNAVHPEREYDREKWMKWWHWMYKKAPFGSKIWLADDDGKIVAQYCAILMNIKIGKDIIKAAQYINLLTHPDYRGQRIYLKLFNTAADDLAKIAVRIGFGFTNDNSYLLAKRRGFLHIPAKRQFVRIFNWANIRKTPIKNKIISRLCTLIGNGLNILVFRASRPPPIKGLTITRISRFDERINEFWTMACRQFPVIVCKNEEILNWRYAAVPDIDYSIFLAEKEGAIRGYLVLRSFQREHKKVTVIYSLLADSEEVSRNLLSEATKYCKKDSVDYIYWVGIASNSYLGTFKKMGFISRNYQTDSKFVVYSSDPNISKELITNPENWLIQVGDSDQL